MSAVCDLVKHRDQHGSTSGVGMALGNLGNALQEVRRYEEVAAPCGRPASSTGSGTTSASGYGAANSAGVLDDFTRLRARYPRSR